MIHYGRLPLLIFFGGVLLAAGLIGAPSRAASEIQISKGQTVYVPPIYSHVYVTGNVPFY